MRHPVRSLLTGAAAMALSTGCVSIDAELAERATPPATWAAVSAERAGDVVPVTENWLSDLNDPVVVALVDEAMVNNNDVAAAIARVRSARANAGQTRSQLLPSVSTYLTGSSTRVPGGQGRLDPATGQIIGGNAASSSDSFGLGFQLSWEADLWGRLTDQTRAAYLDVEGQALTTASTRLSIAGATANAYYALAAAQLQRQLSERDVETGEANLRIIERRYNSGLSSSLDVRLARSSLASSRSTLLQRQQTETESARRLEVLVGRYPDGSVLKANALPELSELIGSDGNLVNIGEPTDLIFRRPDILAAEAAVAAAGLRVSAARKEFIPSLSLSASAEETVTSSSAIAFNPDEVFARLIGNLVQPLFQGGRLRAQAMARKADMEAALRSYSQTALQAFEEVENAITAERLLTARLASQKLAFEEAAAAEELTTRQYLGGTTNIFNLINAQQRRISAESGFIAAAQNRLSNRINLYLALGAPFMTPGELAMADAGRGAQGDPS